MLGADEIVIEQTHLFLSQYQNPAGTISEPFEHAHQHCAREPPPTPAMPTSRWLTEHAAASRRCTLRRVSPRERSNCVALSRLCMAQCWGEADPVHPLRPQAPDREGSRPSRHEHTAEPVEDGEGIGWIGEGIGWIGPDDRGVELEIYLLERPDVLLVIHVMPTELRRRK